MKKKKKSPADEVVRLRKLKQEKLRRLRANNHLEFMRHTWMDQANPFTPGYHTKAICDRIDKAIEDYKKGKSTFLRIAVHQRAGKTEIVSVRLPPRFLRLFPESEIMAVSYNQEQAQTPAYKAMRMVKDKKFQDIFPGTTIGRNAVSNWSLMIKNREGEEETKGRIYSSGLHGGLTGNGYQLGILDDYCGKREHAESSTFREKTWDAFTNDFLTRRGPVSITIVLATWWHEDDLHGRIHKKNDKKDLENYDPDFPEFEFISFPARREDAPSYLQSKYPGEYLFLERFDENWYKSQYASLGPYASAAMMGCNPTLRHGNILNIEEIVEHENEKDFPDIPYYRIWDLAHTAKQRAGDDPDFTGGTYIGFQKGRWEASLDAYLWSIWIKDYRQFREAAPKRDEKIRQTAIQDGINIRILVENSLDSKDAGYYLKKMLGKHRKVICVTCKGDKVVRIAPVETIFENGRVHILKRPWNRVWKDGIQRFDGSGKSHDEMVDNISCGYENICKKGLYKAISTSWG